MSSEAITRVAVGISQRDIPCIFFFKAPLKAIDSSKGLVPMPKTTMKRAPPRAVPVAAAPARAVYTRPQGKSAFTNPRANIPFTPFFCISCPQRCLIQALSLELDLAISSQLASQSEDDPQRITQSRYAQAYRNSGSLSQRQQQIELIMHVGQALDSVVHKFWVYRLLKLLRGPAVAAGFGELQGFLETGFAAFKQLAGAEPFLNAIKTREGAAMETIFAGNDQPFAHLAIA